MDKDHPGIKFFYLILDLFLLNLAVFIVFQFSPLHDYMDVPRRSLYFLHANISEMIAYLLYGRRNFFFTDKYRDRLRIVSIRFVILIATLFILGEIFLPEGYYRIFLLEYVAFFYFFKVITLYFVYKFHKFRHKKGFSHNRVAILGSNNANQALGEILNNNPILGFKFVGYISDKENYNKEIMLGELNELPELAEKHKINMIFVTNPKYFTIKNTKGLLALCNKTGLRVRYVLMNGYWGGCLHRKLESASFFEMFNPQQIPLDDLTLRIEKRFFDFLFSSAVILFIFSWLFPVLAILIKLNSKGPIFFVQQRTGINNKTFNCIKFRTMTVNSDADTKQATKNDSRITSIGNFLRKYNIDELPQFFNVLLGNMSVVGPRPHMLKHTEQYSALIEYYKVRHFVKPGITGWAQVNGYRGLTDELWKMQKRVEYDMAYLEKWNFLWDIKIIFMTLIGKNAYKNAG
ncbi:exopolysaccharide biosynthesis polyprenyl glycosylphosphotransferase [Petrimonas sp.]|uniref:exopolysaccharide biosynthesis polyprenyl glycosylphosphotransferase n=1 Tax=Petrimonas sp. TaxID=2023866 RepID=UPI003F51857C